MISSAAAGCEVGCCPMSLEPERPTAQILDFEEFRRMLAGVAWRFRRNSSKSRICAVGRSGSRLMGQQPTSHSAAAELIILYIDIPPRRRRTHSDPQPVHFHRFRRRVVTGGTLSGYFIIRKVSSCQPVEIFCSAPRSRPPLHSRSSAPHRRLLNPIETPVQPPRPGS